MRIRRTGLLILGLLLVPVTAHATGHNADASTSLSVAGGSTLLGFHETLGLTLPKPGVKEYSILGDFSVYVGSHDNNDLTRLTFMTGLRSMIPHTTQKVFVYGLIGGVHTNGQAENGTDFALALGAGYEPTLFGSRSSEAGWALRFQVDRVFRPGDPSDFFRASAGIVHRFKKHRP